MTESLINGIVKAVAGQKNPKGDLIKVYAEKVIQGATLPFITVNVINTTTTRGLGNQRTQLVQFDVIYHDNGAKVREAMAQKLMLELEYIQLQDGSTSRGINFNFADVDEKMHVTFAIRESIRRIEDPSQLMLRGRGTGGLK